MSPSPSRQRSRRIGGENWAQFDLADPETEAAELAEFESSLKLKRGWNAEGAINVYLRAKGALSTVGQDVASCHRFRHRRWAPNECRKSCLARDLYAYCLQCLPTDLHPRVLPTSRIQGLLIAKAVSYRFSETASFHREVVRDLSRLRIILSKPRLERSRAERSLLLRYAATTTVLRAINISQRT